LVDEARSDGTVSLAELRDLEVVASLLGIPEAGLSQLLNAPRVPVPVSRRPSGSLAGKTVCFTGTLSGCMDGVRISREMAESLACASGLSVLPRVTKKLDILVVADASTCSGKAQKARTYGTTILAESVFWKAIGVAVE
jgi:NAD-dependent DNA ligase